LLAATGADALKVKVGRPGSDSAAEGAAMGAVRRAVGPRPALRADANRAWSLPDAVRFCRAARDSGADLEYLEEPTRAGPGQWRALRRRVEGDGGGAGPPLAADESVDDGSLEAAWRGEFEAMAVVAEEGRVGGGVAGGDDDDGDGWLARDEEDEDEDEDDDEDDDGEGGNGARGPLLAPLLPGDVAAVVLKPSVLGGVSAAWRAARRARLENGVAKVVVSSAFESAAGVALLAHLAAALDADANGDQGGGAVAHGLGTLGWFRADVVPPAFGASSPLPLEPVSNGAAAADAAAAGMSLARASDVLAAAAAAADGGDSLIRRAWEPRVSERVMRCAIESSATTYDVRVVEVLPPALAGSNGSNGNGNGNGAMPLCRRPVVLLHGFLGDAREWLPLARALASAGHPCLALDLPGHGRTRPVEGAGGGGGGEGEDQAYSLPAAAALAREAARQWLSSSSPPSSSQRPLLVGYSLGGRVALQALADMANSSSSSSSSSGNGASAAADAPWAAGFALLSASPGIRAEDQRRQRAARDDELADTLELGGLPAFVDAWYEGPLWAPLRRHGAFARVKARRRGDGDGGDDGGPGGSGADAAELARALRAMSAGRMQPLWREASSSSALALPMLLVAGAEDGKFVSIHRQLAAARRRAAAMVAATATPAADAAPSSTSSVPDMAVEVPGAGHSVHVEAPTAVLDALAAFLGRLEEGEQGGNGVPA
jgi:pimeloyl-ACP methyl ester carboxylesterase/O-succinylbenzoate synthase